MDKLDNPDNQDKQIQEEQVKLDKLDKLQLYTELYDFYGPVLTEKQNICFSMHYLEDMSFSEIGTVLGVTPQAIADQLRRTIGILQNYEDKLGFIKSHHERQTKIGKIIKLLMEVQ